MVTILQHVIYGVYIQDVRCKSTDTKPTKDIENGSTLIEMDTGDGYMFDKDTNTWHKQPAGTIVLPNARGVYF